MESCVGLMTSGVETSTAVLLASNVTEVKLARNFKTGTFILDESKVRWQVRGIQVRRIISVGIQPTVKLIIVSE